VAAVFMECHEDPDRAPSDGPNMINLNDLSDTLKKLIEIDNVVKRKSQ
jgi:2-dehydro-3-deoxyphosphooctonate aldolase (KDO 8-P synthase)